MKSAKYKTAIEQFNNSNVLIIGDVMVDTYLWGEAERISPEAPVPVVRSGKEENRLGGAANVALNIKSLGATPYLCSVIGSDTAGQKFQSLLKENDISTQGLVKSSKRLTTQKTRIFSNNQQMLRYDEETTAELDNELSQKLFKRIKTLLEEVEVVIFQDYDKGVLHQNLISRIIELCQQQGIPTAVDPKKKNFFSFKHCTLFKPNLRELEEGLNLEFRSISKEQLDKAGQQLIQHLPHQNTFVTLASKGVWVRNEQRSTIIPAHAQNVADVSGAGDTVISIASLGLITDLNIFDIAEIANIGAGIVCQEVGVVPVDKGRLLQKVNAQLS